MPTRLPTFMPIGMGAAAYGSTTTKGSGNKRRKQKTKSSEAVPGTRSRS